MRHPRPLRALRLSKCTNDGGSAIVDASNTNGQRVAALSDDELLAAAATVMEELRRRGLLFAVTTAVVDWQDRWFLREPDAASCAGDE